MLFQKRVKFNSKSQYKANSIHEEEFNSNKEKKYCE